MANRSSRYLTVVYLLQQSDLKFGIKHFKRCIIHLHNCFPPDEFTLTQYNCTAMYEYKLELPCSHSKNYTILYVYS